MSNLKKLLLSIALFIGQLHSSQPIDTILVQTLNKYNGIIRTWHTQSWNVGELYVRADVAQLVTAINQDIRNNIISLHPQAIEILKLLVIEHDGDVPVQTELQKIIDYFVSKPASSTHINNKLFNQIEQTVFQISQPQYDGRRESQMNPTKPIETTEQYLRDAHNNIQPITATNLAPYKLIIDSRGDGNCGYRSFVISSCMNYQTIMPGYFQSLITDNFIRLFSIYDTTFTFRHSIFQPIVGEEIQAYLLHVLEAVKRSRNIEDMRRIFNQETMFDFYMTMFLRFMLADYIKHLATPDEIEFIYNTIAAESDAFMSQDATIRLEVEKILTWKNELDDLEALFLAKATSVNIHIVQQNAILNPTRDIIVDNQVADAFILYTLNPGHYKILIPR